MRQNHMQLLVLIALAVLGIGIGIAHAAKRRVRPGHAPTVPSRDCQP